MVKSMSPVPQGTCVVCNQQTLSKMWIYKRGLQGYVPACSFHTKEELNEAIITIGNEKIL